MITFVVRRVLPLVVIAAALVILVDLQDVPQVGSDAWLHLRLGHEFLDGWSLAHPGHLGTFDSASWYPTQWASQVAMAWTEDRAGLAGVMWLAGTLILLLPVVLYLVCRGWAAPLPAALATCIAVCAAAPGLSARPQVVSYLFIALTTSAWLRSAADGRARWWLVALTWVWVPLHGMWLIGLSIAVAAVVGIAASRRHPRRDVLAMALVPVLAGLASLATPLGFDVIRSVADVGSRNDALTEWGPPDFTSPSVLFVAAMIAVIVVVHLRGDSLDWPSVMLLGLGMVWAVYSLRTTIVAAVILAPLLAIALQRFVPRGTPPGRAERLTLVAMTVLAASGLAVISSQRADHEVVPGWVDARLEAMPAGTTVLDDWDLGQYAVGAHPQVDVVMHGYVDVFTPDELQRNIDITTVAPGWDRAVERLGADYAFVDPESSLGYSLVHLLGWNTVEGDDDYVLLTPPESSSR